MFFFRYQIVISYRGAVFRETVKRLFVQDFFNRWEIKFFNIILDFFGTDWRLIWMYTSSFCTEAIHISLSLSLSQFLSAVFINFSKVFSCSYQKKTLFTSWLKKGCAPLTFMLMKSLHRWEFSWFKTLLHRYNQIERERWTMYQIK